jgi:hypothetical protein
MSGMYPCRDTRDTLQMLPAPLLPQSDTRLAELQDNACNIAQPSLANILSNHNSECRHNARYVGCHR